MFSSRIKTKTSLTGSSEETSGSDLPLEQIQNLGKIQISVQRVNVMKRRTTSGPSMAPITTVKEVREKALKGRQIDTIVG